MDGVHEHDAWTMKGQLQACCAGDVVRLSGNVNDNLTRYAPPASSTYLPFTWRSLANLVYVNQAISITVLAALHT